MSWRYGTGRYLMMKRKEFSGRQLEVHNLSSNVPCTLALLATEIHPWKKA